MSTFNLLTNEDKKALKGEYSFRRVSVVLACVAVTAFVGSIFLAPAFLVSYFRLKDVQQTAEILKTNIAIKKQTELGELVAATNKKMAALAMKQDFRVGLLIDSVERHRTPDIRIVSFRFGVNEKDKERRPLVFISGSADTREALVAFTRRLRSDPAFANVDLPISNFAADHDIRFSITINVK